MVPLGFQPLHSTAPLRAQLLTQVSENSDCMVANSSVQFKSARELHELECSTAAPLPSGCSTLDELIGGGFLPGCVTEISGEAGCGKSQICMQFVATTIARGANVVCIETERGFSVKRVHQMLGYHTNDVGAAMHRLLISSPTTMEQMMYLLTKLEGSPEQLATTSAVVVDAIATFFRGCSSKEEFQEWRNVLTILFKIALHHSIAVIYVNHVTAREDVTSGEWTTMPFLSSGFTRRPTIQLWLERMRCGSEEKRQITVRKSPFCPSKTANYSITDSGVSFVCGVSLHDTSTFI
ncbi:hypothetical protein RB195_009691 [Necator americanus]|uniref:RecA family profile 1 domain-containing protein n=1 Tax=Necator americanus TaxID=51031 RepID=A0ABR1CUF8_NECAM